MKEYEGGFYGENSLRLLLLTHTQADFFSSVAATAETNRDHTVRALFFFLNVFSSRCANGL